MVFKQFFLLLCLFSFQVFATEVFATEVSATKDTTRNYTMNIGSYVYHIPEFFETKEYTQEFDNGLFALGFRIGPKEYFKIGTLLNSFESRCFLVGVKRSWRNFDNKFIFQGFYGYVGEFFFDVFKDCANLGLYRTFEEHTSLQGVPYIFHGFEYSFLPHMSVEFGLLLPGLFLATFEIRF